MKSYDTTLRTKDGVPTKPWVKRVPLKEKTQYQVEITTKAEPMSDNLVGGRQHIERGCLSRKPLSINKGTAALGVNSQCCLYSSWLIELEARLSYEPNMKRNCLKDSYNGKQPRIKRRITEEVIMKSQIIFNQQANWQLFTQEPSLNSRYLHRMDIRGEMGHIA